MDEVLQAIRDKREIEFLYDGLPRVVRPAAVGKHASTGRELLRGYQVAGASRSNALPAWEFYSLVKIGNLVVTGRLFEVPPGYVRNDSHLETIFGQLQ